MTAREKNTAKPVVRRDGEAIVVEIPMSFRRRSGRKEVVLPPGAVAPSAIPAKPPTPLEIALARAFRWQEMIETGAAKSNPLSLFGGRTARKSLDQLTARGNVVPCYHGVNRRPNRASVCSVRIAAAAQRKGWKQSITCGSFCRISTRFI